MASLYVAEFKDIGGTSNFPVAGAQTPPLAEQKITIAATAASSSAFGATTLFVRCSTDAICSVAFGTGPTATAGNMRMPANSTEYFSVVPGQKLSVISNS